MENQYCDLWLLIQVGGLNQKEGPKCQCKKPQEKFWHALMEDLLHQDGGGLMEGFCPKGSGPS